jgi:hypothetical protein
MEGLAHQIGAVVVDGKAARLADANLNGRESVAHSGRQVTSLKRCISVLSNRGMLQLLREGSKSKDTIETILSFDRFFAGSA